MLPVWCVKVPRFVEVYVPTAPSHHEPFKLDASQGVHEVVQQDDVGVDVTEEVVSGLLFDLFESGVEQRRAELVAADFRKMRYSELLRGLCRTGVVGAQDNLTGGKETTPTFDGIALDDAIVAFKRLGYGKDRQQRCLLWVRVGEKPGFLHSDVLFPSLVGLIPF